MVSCSTYETMNVSKARNRSRGITYFARERRPVPFRQPDVCSAWFAGFFLDAFAKYCHFIAMAKHQIVLKPSAVRDLDGLRRYDAAMIADGMERFLSGTPTQESKSRIKRLRGVENPDYRLRLGEYRVFYNVDTIGRRVEVLRILHKDQTPEYYEEVRK